LKIRTQVLDCPEQVLDCLLAAESPDWRSSSPEFGRFEQGKIGQPATSITLVKGQNWQVSSLV